MPFLKTILVLMTTSAVLSITKGQNVETKIDRTSCFYGGNLTMICELKEMTSAVMWTYREDKVSMCITKTSTPFCELNPEFSEQYKFSHDAENSVFNLTLLNVNGQHNGRKYVCSDGTHSDCLVVNVEECNSLRYDKERGRIIANSGCISEDENVTFIWKMDEGVDYKKIEFQPKNLNKSNLPCSNECGKNKQIRHEEYFPVALNGNGKKHFIYIEFRYGKEHTESRQTHFPFTINDKIAVDDIEPSAGIVWPILPLSVIAVVVAIICALESERIKAKFQIVKEWCILKIARNRTVVNTHHVEDEEAAIQECATTLLSKNVSEKEIDCHQIEDINILTIVDIPMPNLHTTMVDTGATILYSTEDALSVNIQQ